MNEVPFSQKGKSQKHWHFSSGKACLCLVPQEEGRLDGLEENFQALYHPAGQAAQLAQLEEPNGRSGGGVSSLSPPPAPLGNTSSSHYRGLTTNESPLVFPVWFIFSFSNSGFHQLLRPEFCSLRQLHLSPSRSVWLSEGTPPTHTPVHPGLLSELLRCGDREPRQNHQYFTAVIKVSRET